MEINETQWNQMTKRLDALEQSISDDRRDIDKISIDMATVKEQMNRILGVMNKNQAKTTEVIQNAISEATEPLREAVEVMSNKPIRITSDQAGELTLIQSLHKTIRSWKR